MVHDPREGVTAHGMIVTGVGRHRVPSAFEAVLTAAVRAVQEHDGQASLYVYGSVATGEARVPTSDVDLLSIGLDRDVAGTVSRQLSATYASICRAVEIGPAERGDFVGDGDEAYGNLVFVRHYGVPLIGQGSTALDDVLDDAYRADVRAARGFNGDIAQHAERWREALMTVRDRPALGRVIARKTLLAVAGLVSVHDSTWTTDRARAALRWAVIQPALREELELLCRWSENLETPTASEITEVLDGVVADVVSAFATMIGLWQQGDAGGRSLQ